MKIAVVTMPVKTGKCEENYNYMVNRIHEAIQQNVSLIVFPQSCISGVGLGDAWSDTAFCKYVDSFNERILQYSHKIAIVWGNVRYRGNRLFQCAFYAKDGIQHMRVKPVSNVYGINESQYFSSMPIQSSIELEDYVCALNFGTQLTLCDLNINLDACAFSKDKTIEVKGNTIYCNAIGMITQGKTVHVLQGGSCVYRQNECLYQAPYLKEDMAIIEYETAPVVSKQQPPKVFDVLLYGIACFDQETLGGKMPWIVGLSGGLDSSVTASLLAMALGPKRVYGYNMATTHNSLTTISNARSLANALGISYREGSIEKLVDASVAVMEDYQYDSSAWPSLVKENIQARIRGHMLSTFASILGGVIVNNGNKVEATLGYCTLYGDAIGALCVIGDLNKMELFDLSKEINERYGKEVIPASLLPKVEGNSIVWEMPPSAELAQGQFDPMKWFYHDMVLDRYQKEGSFLWLMKEFYDGSIKQGPLWKWIQYYHLEEPEAFLNDLHWLQTTIQRNTFKRVQLPPTLMLSERGNKMETQCLLDRSYEQKLKDKILRKSEDC